jgi:prefoldin alpha subunit
MASSNQEQFRRLAVELRILEGTAETLQARLNLVHGALTELSIARATLEGVEKESPDAFLFVPIGGGSFVKARLESSDKVVVGMGAGVSTERSMVEAKQIVQSRLGELEKTRGSLQQQLVQVVDKIQEDRDRLQELSVRLSQVERRPDVSEAEGRSQRSR